MTDPISVTDIINKIIELGNTKVYCNQPCPFCEYDPFCESFFQCYKQAIKHAKKEDKDND